MIEFFNQILDHFQIPLTNPIIVFSLILFIILLAPIVLKKLSIPGIIGLIIAGIVIGPKGFGVLENDSAVNLFSTIGLLYIMFIAGLDLDLNQFKAHRYKSIFFGLFTFLIPLGIGFPVYYYVFSAWDGNITIEAALLVASMFGTHTLVTYPIVSKMGISKNTAVAITVGGTMLTDTAVLILFAVIMGSHDGGLSQEFWLRLGISIALFSAFMFLIIPMITKWFFRKFSSDKHQHYIFVLAVVFLAAFLAEISGLEAIIGAFFAGLALNRLIPNSSALMNRIEFLGNSLFIPFFFISVGMIVDVSVIFTGWMAVVIAATLTVVALTGKWLAAKFTQLVFKFSRAQGNLIFGLSSAHAAATLAIIVVGHEAGIIDDNILNGTVILILITCIVASFVTERASKKIVIESEDDVEGLAKSSGADSERILIPIDNISKVEKLLEFASLIKDKKSPNPISVLTVVSNNDEAEANILKSRSKLDSFVSEASATETKTEILTTIDHNAANGISRISREIMADIIILGWPHRAGFFDKFIGEKINNILRKTYKTTFVCHLEKPLATHKKLIIAVPPLAEREKGFHLWVSKFAILAQELSIPILVYCNPTTEVAIKKQFKDTKISNSITMKHFDNWEDFLILSRDVRENDIFVLISARKGAKSYLRILEQLPTKLDQYFPANSRFVIYPQHFDELIEDTYGDISSEPLNKGIDVVQRLGKGIGSIFKIESESDKVKEEEEEK